MKLTCLLVFLLTATFSFSQEDDWVKTEGVITEITIHTGKRTRESATIKFNLEDGSEQLGTTDLFRIPFLGSFKSVGDKIHINYRPSQPMLLETTIGNILSKYGMYILIVLGIIFSIKPFLKMNKNKN